jgi:amino acid adenylation domain-containing protein
VKAETKITGQISSGHTDLESQQADSCQGYKHQQEIRAKCYHPLGIFEEFPKEDVETSIPKRFEKIVSIYSDRLALGDKNHTLTYDQLNKAANRLAHTILAERGDRPEPIALLFSEDVEAIVAILGVLKARKFYVPLDPNSPLARNAFIIRDCKTEVLLTDRVDLQLARQLGTNQKLSLIDTDRFDKGPADYNPPNSLSPDFSACILYTSGSTGEPKGVIQNHRNLLHWTKVHTNNLHICSNDRLTLLQRYTVASCLHNLFGSLLNGASLHPFDPRLGGTELARWLIGEEITLYHSVVMVLRQIFDALHGMEEFPDLRVIRLSGMAITAGDVERYQRHFSSKCILVHVMGSTEAGTVPHFFGDQASKFNGSEVPVGYAEEDAEIALVDENGGDVGIGKIGEIAIKSCYLAEGYWRHPDLTKAKFLPDPNGQNRRTYLTGDMGRIGPDGCLFHLGRKDFQVNIRGFRVETGEVEKTLLNHKAIREVVVKAEVDKFGDSRLVAYFVPTRKPGPRISELQRTLKQKLPHYMIPSVFVQVDSFPLLPSGKINRKALVCPSDLRPDLESPYLAPRFATEGKLAEIWADVLGLDRVGIHDDFFELGGHSLVATRVLVEVEKVFGKQFPPTTLYWARTIEQLASIVQQNEWSAPWSLLFPIQPAGSKPPFFWVYGETSDVLLPRYLGPDQPLYGLMHEARIGNRVRYTKLTDIAANHLKDIQTVQPQGPYFLGGFCFGGMVAFEIAQQLKKQGQEVALLFLVDLGTLQNWRSRFEKIVSFGDKISHHSRNLASIGVREKFKYVQTRIKDRIRGIICRGQNIAEQVARNAYFVSGHPLPPLLRQQYVSSVDQWAMRHYEPEAYPGDVILFKAKASPYDPRIIGRLTAGQLHLYELPCRHADMIIDPHVSVWANQLKGYLQEAQAIQRGAHPYITPKENKEESVLEQAIEQQQM